jgi:acetyl esterase/lipase
MKFLDYEVREPMRPVVAAYHERAVALGAAAQGTEHAYGEHALQRLAVYPATRPNGEVLLAFHGGAWSSGYKEWLAMMAPPLNARGISLVSAGYRLGPANPFPAGFADCARALSWVHAHLDDLSAQPDAIFLGGHSSGAHLAALLALAPEAAGVSDLPPVAGCLPVSGIYLFGSGSEAPPPPALFPGGASEERYASASPLRCPLQAAPAFLIAWGSDDFAHIRTQSPLLAKALGDAGRPAQELVLQGCDHFQASHATADADGPWVKAAERFMRSHRSAAR